MRIVGNFVEEGGEFCAIAKPGVIACEAFNHDENDVGLDPSAALTARHWKWVQGLGVFKQPICGSGGCGVVWPLHGKIKIGEAISLPGADDLQWGGGDQRGDFWCYKSGCIDGSKGAKLEATTKTDEGGCGEGDGGDDAAQRPPFEINLWVLAAHRNDSEEKIPQRGQTKDDSQVVENVRGEFVGVIAQHIKQFKTTALGRYLRISSINPIENQCCECR